jgi:hypothetical protein
VFVRGRHDPRPFFALAIVMFASACISFSIQPIASTPTTSGTQRPVSAGKGFGLVSDQNGQTVLIDADTDIIRLVLEDEWAWSVQVDPTYLQLYQQGPLYGQGFVAQAWFYKLLRTGETKVTATGTPKCRSATPRCESPDRGYVVTIQTR